ncbi:MAG: flagella basal body P-ring formation protein FlgA [Nocardioidaceae bacterium]|nr:flagella basal body P-ring formation protein FlgA [Nocardioidaceae bacterium]
MTDLHRVASNMRRAMLRHRRLIAATSAAAAVWSTVHILSPTPPPATAVAVASHDLEAGTVLSAADVRVIEWASELVPTGASPPDQLAGQTVAGPMRAGEPLTDRRVIGAASMAGYADGLVAAPVRIHDSDVVALLRVGDRIDLYAAAANTGSAAQLLVDQAPVVTLPQLDDDSRDGGLIVIAVTPDDAARLAQASAMAQLSVTLRG